MKRGTRGQIAIGITVAVIGTFAWAGAAKARKGGIPQCLAELDSCQAATCGNGVAEFGEACDEGNLQGESCVTQGFLYGELVCSGSCTLDTSRCTDERFVANGDGTVTDNETARMWVQTTDDGGLRDKDNFYRWSFNFGLMDPDGTAFTEYLDGLNNTCEGEGITPCAGDVDCSGVCGFAGHRNWRLPEVNRDGGTAELETILLSFCPGGGVPCIDEATFGPTAADGYWSSITFAGNPLGAWGVDFGNGLGTVFSTSKGNDFRPRAVRTGP